MLAVVGTVPRADFPLVSGKVVLDRGQLVIDTHRIPVNRGTPALLAAAARTLQAAGAGELHAFLVGDIGLGQGSRKLYRYLTAHLVEYDFDVLAFHYLQPDVDWHNRVLFAVAEMARRPRLIADAGFMYAAKMSGQAPAYDLFTPDVGELAFLADETAPHPFYTRGFILHEDNRVPDLIERAYQHKNAARYLLVKGCCDYLAGKKGLLGRVDRPVAEAMEAMGGTGDTLTGLVAALSSCGMPIEKAALAAARANRLAGCLADPTPATQVSEIVRHIDGALAQVL